MHEIKVTKGEVGIAMGDGIAFLEQEDIYGSTNTLIVSKKQLADITTFLLNPTRGRLRTVDKLLGVVTVRYSSKDELFTIEQGKLKLYGDRQADCFKFTQVGCT